MLALLITFAGVPQVTERIVVLRKVIWWPALLLAVLVALCARPVFGRDAPTDERLAVLEIVAPGPRLTDDQLDDITDWRRGSTSTTATSPTTTA